MSITTKEVLRIGRVLSEKKKELLHGEWSQWIAESDLGLTDRTAHRYRIMFERLSDHQDLIKHLPLTTLFALTAKSTSDMVVEAVLDLLRKGEEVTVKTVAALNLAEAELREDALLFAYDIDDLQTKVDEYDLWENDEQNAGFIYICRGPNGYRIGQTTDLTARLNVHKHELPITSPLIYVFLVDDPIQMEAELHSHFESKRVHLDWFALSDEDIEAIKKKLGT